MRRSDLQRLLMRSAFARSIAWKLGRRLYAAARGEPRCNDIRVNGEAYVQRCVLRGCADERVIRVVDIGANEGMWTQVLAGHVWQVGRSRDSVIVDLFEPVPSTIERLSHRVKALSSTLSCRIHPIAASDTEGRVLIGINSETGGTNSLHGDGRASARGSIEIETATIDTFSEQHGIERLHLAKCDTEGHDLMVLKGARGMLTAARIDVFQFEYNHRWVFSRSFLKDVFELVRGLPYTVARIMPQWIELLPEWHPELERYFEANYVLVHAGALHWFNTKAGRFDVSNVFRF